MIYQNIWIYGIYHFLSTRNKSIINIFSDKKTLNELIYFLKYEFYYKFKYIDIMNKLFVSKKIIEQIKK